MCIAPGILRLALPTPLRRAFDYLPPQGVDLSTLTPGVRVTVPFQSRVLTGVLLSVEKKSDVPYEKLKRALQIIDDAPVLSDEVYQLCAWAAGYYHYSIGEILNSAMPAVLRKGEPMIVPDRASKAKEETIQADAPLELNHEQSIAVERIQAALGSFNVFLLHGVTGSGKTEVYLQTIAHCLSQGKNVLVLVPEISLTPQTVSRFKARFTESMVTMHSGMTDKARFAAWMAARSGEASIIIGTRSAIFTPTPSLGLIIVDEEHDTSFKQHDHLRYHARDLAVMRGSMNHCPVVLGSATPSLESLFNAKRERYTVLSLPARAGGAQLPDYHLVDLRSTPTHDGLSATLLQAMREHLDADQQVLLFLNRRGFSPAYYCTQCGHIVECERCDSRMVYHQSPPRLHCHHCDKRRMLPSTCDQCHAEAMQAVGMGTERVEEALQPLFPDVPIIRIDRDSTRRKGSMQALLKQIHKEKKAILLGTQMLAKGHHFPRVTLVGILEADGGLFSADFRAAEHMGQLLMQVSGRAGRGEQAGMVMIQTHYPEHPLLATLLHQGYGAFAETLLNEREMAQLPPYSYVAIFRAEAHQEKAAEAFLQHIKKTLPMASDDVSVLGPVPALMAKRKGFHRQQLLLKTNKRSVMQSALKNSVHQLETDKKARSVKWVLDVDPVEV